MLGIYILNETFTAGLSYNLLNFLSIVSVISGLFVIISKNPIVSVLFLIALFFNIAGYLMMVGINFIGLSYLLVYVGAVSILFLFILMLINVRISELLTNNNNSIPLAVMIGVFFNAILYRLLPSNFTSYIYSYNIELDEIYYLLAKDDSNSNNFSHIINNLLNLDNSNLSFVSSQMWDGYISETSHITSIGNVIYTVYPVWLILTSIILLLAMVGAIVITIKQ